MIKAEELKNGNRILAPEPVYKRLINCEVISMDQNEVVVKTNDSQFNTNVIDVEPIAINEQLLKDNGFLFDNTNQAVLDHFILPTKPGTEGWFQDQGLEKKCNYLHELQNAYEKETGILLPIKCLPDDIKGEEVNIADIFGPKETPIRSSNLP